MGWADKRCSDTDIVVCDVWVTEIDTAALAVEAAPDRVHGVAVGWGDQDLFLKVMVRLCRPGFAHSDNCKVPQMLLKSANELGSCKVNSKRQVPHT